MIARILDFSVHQRWLVVLLVALAAAFGLRSLGGRIEKASPRVLSDAVAITTRRGGSRETCCR